MFSRKSQSEGKSLPENWIETTQELFQQNYKDYCEKNKVYFDVFGKIFSDEMVVVISLLHQTEIQNVPITVFLSADLTDKNKAAPDKLLDDMLNLISHIFDDIFQTNHWSDYHDQWLETTYKKSQYFYKITRENIRLTLEADALLKADEQ